MERQGLAVDLALLRPLLPMMLYGETILASLTVAGDIGRMRYSKLNVKSVSTIFVLDFSSELLNTI